MKKEIHLFVLLFIVCNSHAQLSINKLWDYGYGGYGDDACKAFIATADGGFVLAGNTDSQAGADVSQTSRGITDYWMIKTDANGQKQWDKRFGGSSLETATCVAQTKDGGYLIAGHSGSGISGDKTQDSRGNFDYWVVKTDGNGNKLWDERYGGPSGDYLWAMTLTKDGGALLGGYSESGIGGDKSEPKRGIFEDYWVVKIDSLGNKQWDKTFGGGLQDFCEDVIQTADGGYLLGGQSRSDSSGDKTENNWGTGDDIWVVKIDSNGNKQWDRTLGTSTDDVFLKCFQKTNGNFLSIGGALNGISGNKSITKGGAWFVELNNGGTIIGEFSITGPRVSFLKEFEDGGYIMGGSSGADTSADKSEFGLGTLFVRTDSLGSRIWDKTIVANAGGYSTLLLNDCYAVGGRLRIAPNGYQTAINHDPTYQTADFWLMKFCLEDWNGIDDRPQTADQCGIQMQVYPNPFTGDLSIATMDDIHEAAFTITDVNGKVVYHKEETNLAKGYTKVLDLHSLPSGVYFVNAESDGQCVSKRVVKE